MKNNSALERLYNGIIKENPTLVLILGMCPTLAVTTSAINGAGMGLSTTVVLMFSNMIISILRNFIPDRVRIPGYIVIIASLVTVVQFLLQGYVPALNDALGVYIPLIVVNCIILGRAEAFASKHSVVDSMLDALGVSIGFAFACLIIAFFRELIGTGGFTLSNPFDSSQTVSWLPLKDYAWSAMTGGIGGFMTFGFVLGVYNTINILINSKKEKKIEAQKALASSKGAN